MTDFVKTGAVLILLGFLAVGESTLELPPRRPRPRGYTKRFNSQSPGRPCVAWAGSSLGSVLLLLFSEWSRAILRSTASWKPLSPGYLGHSKNRSRRRTSCARRAAATSLNMPRSVLTVAKESSGNNRQHRLIISLSRIELEGRSRQSIVRTPRTKRRRRLNRTTARPSSAQGCR